MNYIIDKIYHRRISDCSFCVSIVLRNIHRVTICQDSKPEGENVDVLNQGGVGWGLNICDVKEEKNDSQLRRQICPYGEVLAGHLAKSYKVRREAFFSPIVW